MASCRLVFAGILASAALRAADPSLAPYSRAEIEPARTSIVVGSVLLSVTPLDRHGGIYESRYSAKVFPFIFLNEAGKFRIDMPDSSLRSLAAGRPIGFTGVALRDDGVTRAVDGRAVPMGPSSGMIKVRVFLSSRVILVFDTTYRLAGS